MRVAVLAGGRTPERDISLRGGHRVMTSLNDLGYEAWIVDPAETPLVTTLQERPPDLCWLSLHGKEGEDGTVQRLLGLLDLPFTGTAPSRCTQAFDKVLAKDVLLSRKIPTPEAAVIEGPALRDLGAGAALATVAQKIGFPCVVKPSRSGSALGVSIVERESALPPAVMSALAFSEAAIIERHVAGTEVAVSLVGEPLESLPPVEIVAKNGLYDYAARYTAGATEYFAPARLDPGTAELVTEAANRTAAAFELRDFTRVDIIVDAGGRPWVLEVNVSPGLTETSLLPMAASAAGISFDGLCDIIIQAAGERGGRASREPDPGPSQRSR